MTIGDSLVTLHLPHTSGLVKDEVQMSFAFSKVDPASLADSDIESLLNVCIGVFTNTRSSGHKIGDRINKLMSRSANAAVAKRYTLNGHLDGSDHGSPTHMLPWTLPATSDYKPLPQEVALAASFTANLAGLVEVATDGTRPKARRRGRVYFGPFSENELGPTTTDNVPAAGLIADIGEAMNDLHDAALAIGFTWCVWSRVSATLYPVTTAWVDNEWDTQRRRGQQHKTKSFVTL